MIRERYASGGVSQQALADEFGVGQSTISRLVLGGLNGKHRAFADARRLGFAAFVEEVDPQVVFERDEGVCGICGGVVERDRFDVDHVIPLALGGEHSYENARLAHVSCNRRRGRLTKKGASA